jgi:hypothetical protein
MKFIFYDCFGSLRSPNYNNNSYTRELSIKILQNWSNCSVDYIYVPLENISLIWTCHHCRWRAVKLGQCSALRTFEQGGGSKYYVSCHTCFDTGPRSHPQHDAITLCVVRGDWMGRSFRWDQENRDLVLQQVCTIKKGTVRTLGKNSWIHAKFSDDIQASLKIEVPCSSKHWHNVIYTTVIQCTKCL